MVAEAKVKRFEKPWSILIDSGASCNYSRRRSLEGSQLYAEALTVHEGDPITVRLATVSRITVPKIPLNLGIKFLDFVALNAVMSLIWTRDMIALLVWLGLNAMIHGLIGGRRP